MRLTLSALAMLVGLPLLGSSQANAYFWYDDSYVRPHYTYYGYRDAGPRSYYSGRRYDRGMRYYRSGRPESYRTGSRRWWGAMDREDRGGRGRP